MKARFITFIIIASVAASAHAREAYVIGNNSYGCIHKADYKKTDEYVVANDLEGFKAFLGLAIATGVCTLFRDGEPVVVLDSGLFTSKVRRKGELTEYYVDSGSIGK